MENIVITIARQYGSGGKTVGGMVADRLGIPCYNREILRMASDESGINEKLFAQADEKIKKSALFRISKSVYEGELLRRIPTTLCLPGTCLIIRPRSSRSWRRPSPASS